MSSSEVGPTSNARPWMALTSAGAAASASRLLTWGADSGLRGGGGRAAGGDGSDAGAALGLGATVAIGIGGMVGGGIFAVLGLAAELARGATPIAFLLAGLVALATAYAYSKLSVAFPSRGGTVEFLTRAFGTGLGPGTLNVLLWVGYIVMLSLYAFAFGSYGATFLPAAWQGVAGHVLSTLAVLGFTALNIAGSSAVGRAEVWIVGTKLAVLGLFVVAGAATADPTRLAPSEWGAPLGLFAGGMVIFLAYEGFELIANAAEDVRDPKRTLPRAYHLAVGSVIVLYVAIAYVAIGNLGVDELVGSEDFALAAAARPFLGQAGFALIAFAALLSTGSAINATLYGGSRVSYMIAKEGELPEQFEHRVWSRPVEGLLITAAATVVVVNLLDLTSISTMGSAGFLLVFAAVNLAAFRLRAEAGARGWVCLVAAGLCLVALGALLVQVAQQEPERGLVLAALVGASFAVEWAYRSKTGRSLASTFMRGGRAGARAVRSLEPGGR